MCSLGAGRPSVTWHDSLCESDDALRVHASDVLGVSPFEVRVGRHCARCGSNHHGQPWSHGPDGRWAQLSLSRSGDHLVTAACLDARVGIDVESVAMVNERWDPDLVLHRSETARTHAERAAMWCRKEALLKATGDGLEVPMTSIRCADWAVYDVPAPAGMWASLALVPLDQRSLGGTSSNQVRGSAGSSTS